MSAPEVGKRYRIEAEVEVAGRMARPMWATDAVSIFVLANGETLDIPVPCAAFTWTEVEPEYVVGALYEDANGRLVRRLAEPLGGWRWALVESSRTYVIPT